jgi:hypothetical protein
MAECGTPLDDRIDAKVFALNQRATAVLPKWFEGVQIETVGALPVRCEEIWVAYLAAEIYNNADAALICITHNRGRAARILERQMYEALVKANFYVAHPDLARLEYLAMPFRDLALEKQLKRDPASVRYAGIAAAVDVISKKFPEVVTYVAEHKKEIDLRSMVGPQNDPDVDFEYAYNYRRLSQTPHGGVSGMHDVFDYRTDDKVGIWFDGRLPDPTFAVESMTLLLFDYLDLMNSVFHLGKADEIAEFYRENGEIIARLWPDGNADITTTEES